MNYFNRSTIKMTDWPVDARAFSRPTSKAREKRPRDEVESSVEPIRQQIEPAAL